MVRLLRATVTSVAALPQDGFLPRMDAWRAALTPQTRALVINYPSNPTGVIPSREYLQALLAFAAEHDLWVISDEVYENLYYDEKPVSTAAACPAGQQLVQDLRHDRLAGRLPGCARRGHRERPQGQPEFHHLRGAFHSRGGCFRAEG
jgi:DNA-binding transcriptional MocR family regulator